MQGKTVVVLAGPTAVGKTAVALHIARHFRTCIISADSRQCYRELNIGVARPTEAELKEIPHYFIASHSVTEEVNAASFEQYALETVQHLFEKHDVVVMCGGTGLYIRAFCEGLDDMPSVRPEIRDQIISAYQENGLEWLKNEVREKDPLFFSTGETENPQRMMRALEVWESTGRSVIDFRKGKPKARPFAILKLALELPRPVLNERIDQRVDQMVTAGLVEEVKGLISYRHLNALQTVGYSEIFEYLDQRISLEEAISMIRKNTRQYAKRQMTWFRKDREFTWFDPAAWEQIITYLEKNINPVS